MFSSYSSSNSNNNSSNSKEWSSWNTRLIEIDKDLKEQKERYDLDNIRTNSKQEIKRKAAIICQQFVWPPALPFRNVNSVRSVVVTLMHPSQNKQWLIQVKFMFEYHKGSEIEEERKKKKKKKKKTGK